MMAAEPIVSLTYIEEERAAYTVASPPVTTPGGEGVSRKNRVRAAIRAGQMVPSADVDQAEFFTSLPHPWMIALAKTHHLRVTELHFLLMLLMHSRGMGSPFAVVEPFDHTPPTNAQWCAWLDWKLEQLCNVRKSLLDRRVIHLVDNDPAKLAFQDRWEEWDTAVFARHPQRRAMGRTARQQPQSAPHYLMSTPTETAPSHLLMSDVSSNNEESLIKQCDSKRRQPRRQAGPRDALKNRRIEEYIQRETNVSPADGASTPPQGDGFLYHRATGNHPDTLPDSGSEPPPDSAAPPPARAPRHPAIPRGERLLPGEQEYRLQLLEAIQRANDGAKPPEWGRAWKSARFYFRDARNHPANIESVVACYREMKRHPKWEFEYLYLDKVKDQFDGYERNPARFRARVDKERGTDEWVRRKQEEERTGKPARPLPADALNPSVASTPDTIPVINVAAETRRKMAEYEAQQRATAEAARLRMRQIAQRAGGGEARDASGACDTD